MHQPIEFKQVPMLPVIKPTLRTEERDIMLEALAKFEHTLFRAQNTLANHRKAAALRSARLQLTEQRPTKPIRFAQAYAKSGVFLLD